MEDDGHAASDGTNDRQRPWGASPFGNIGASVGIIASLSVIVSFIYDWGFFSTLGISFSQAPTTITDHVQTWLIWLPGVIVMVIFVLARELFLIRVERGMTEEELIAASRHPRRTKIIRAIPIYLIVQMCIAIVILWLLFGELLFTSALISLAVCWVAFMGWVFGHSLVNNRLSYLMKLFSFFAPPLVFVVFSLGASSAGITRAEPPMSHRLVIDGKAGAREIVEIELLRAFEKWLLVRDENKQLSWVRLDEVKRMEPLKGPNPFKGLACAISSRWCLPRTSVD